jgi:hypothetical protein
MSRPIIALADEQRTSCALEAFSTPFPKAPGRWRSHDHFTPRPLALTAQGDVDGGLSWLVGATIDFGFTRAICAPTYGRRVGHCYDPASLVFLERAAPVDQYVDYARFCADLHQQDQGRRSRELAGLGDAIPGEDDLSNFRQRVGVQALEVTMAVVVELFRTFGLLTGELVSTDGQLEPSSSRFKGCAYACEGCQALPLDEACHQELGRQLHNGAQRLQLTCPFPDVVAKVRQATTKKGTPTAPKVALLELEAMPTGLRRAGL